MKKMWISSAHQGFVRDAMHSNTLSAFYLAAQMGADMIETDARTTSDGVIVACHDPDAVGLDANGNTVAYEISKTHSDVITNLILAPNDPLGVQYVPTLEQVLSLAYHTGIEVNIDLKEGIHYAMKIAQLVCQMGMRGKVIYATNGSGTECIRQILQVDPTARFIDTPYHYTAEKLASIPGYQAKCFAYTSDFSDESITRIRKSGCMLAAIGLNLDNASAAFRHHPDMAEYPHTSDFVKIDSQIHSRRFAALDEKSHL